MPLSGFRLALIARNSPVYHLLGLSIFAARLIRSYMGYVPEMPSIQLSSCMRETDPLTYFPVGGVVLVYDFPMFFKNFFNFRSSLTLR